MKKFKFFSLGLTGLALIASFLALLLILAQVMTGSFILDIAVSFLPYTIPISILGALVIFVCHKVISKSQNRFTKLVNISPSLAIILLTTLLLTSSLQIISFSYGRSTLESIPTNLNQPVRVAFFNKLFTNNN